MNHYENHIQPFCNLTKVPVTFFNTEGASQWECCPEGKICSFFDGNYEHHSNCRKTLISSINMAAQLGEPYIFLCRSGLINIAIASIRQNKLQGAFIAGPIPMGNNRETVMRNLLKNSAISPRSEIYSKFIVYLSQMNISTPNEISDLSALFNSTILYSLNTIDEYREIQENYKKQTHFSEKIQKQKRAGQEMDYPHELEEQLIQYVKAGDRKGANQVLLELLDKIFLLEYGDLAFIKVRVLGLCTILTRVTSKKEDSFHVSSEEIKHLDLLNKAENFLELCHLTAEICENICAGMTSPGYKGNSLIITNACQYIDRNYMNKITLKIVADELFTNPSYLSTLFKKEIGISFTEYINGVRINHAQDLLKNTNLNLVDISAACGFDCQSYFTKIFKKKNGVTPSEYRKGNQIHSL